MKENSNSNKNQKYSYQANSFDIISTDEPESSNEWKAEHESKKFDALSNIQCKSAKMSWFVENKKHESDKTSLRPWRKYENTKYQYSPIIKWIFVFII